MKNFLLLMGILVFPGFIACDGNNAYNSNYDPNPEVDMVLIKAGTFNMGCVGVTYAEPVHKVTLTKDFYMSKYTITVKEFRKFAEHSGYKTRAETDSGGKVWIEQTEHFPADSSWKNPYYFQNENHPVVLISWNDAIAYCNWLSKVSGLTPVYTVSGDVVIPDWDANGYRLPTEAEWEYCCRAGTNTLYSTGSTITTYDAWYLDNSNYGTNEVGLKPPNKWGLYDMQGNVWEWVWDWKHDSYTPEPKTDPKGPDTPTPNNYHATRGGSWINYAWRLNSAERSYGTPSYRTNLLGFRVVLPYRF